MRATPSLLLLHHLIGPSEDWLISTVNRLHRVKVSRWHNGVIVQRYRGTEAQRARI